MAYTDLLQRGGGGDASALLRAYEAAVQKQYDARQQAAQNGAGGETLPSGRRLGSTPVIEDVPRGTWDVDPAAITPQQASAPAAQKRPGGFGGGGFGGEQKKYDFGTQLAADGKLVLNGMAKAGSSFGAFIEDRLDNVVDILNQVPLGTTKQEKLAAAGDRRDLAAALQMGLFRYADRNIDEETQANRDAAAQNAERIDTGNDKTDEVLKWLSNRAGDVTYAVGAALPMAAEALATGGASAASGVASSADDLARTFSAAAESSGILKTASTSLRNLLRSRSYWTAVASEVGQDYQEKLAQGYSEDEALRYAISTAMVNGAIEVGGGIQKPEDVKTFGDFVRKVVLGEAAEEAEQGVVSRGMENLTLGADNPAFSLTDERAIINPATSAKEAAMGGLVGAILGGGQQLIGRGAQALTDAHTGDAAGTGDTSSARSAGTFPSRGRLADGVQPSTQGEGGQNAPPFNRASRIGAAEGNLTTVDENAVAGQETAPTASFSDPLTRAIFGEPAANENAASQEATSAAYYDPMMAAAIRREGKTFRNLVAGVDTSVSDFFSKWKRGRNTTNGDKLEKLYLAQMPENVRQRVADILGYDVGNRDFIFTNENAKHIFDEHGDADAEIRKGNIPLDPWVLDALPEVLTSPDSVAPGHLDKKGDRLGVVFTKAMPNGVVVTVQFDNKGRGTMEARTVYAKEGGSTPSVSRPSSDEESSTIRPRRPEPVLPSTDATIAQPSEVVKRGNAAEEITVDGGNMSGELGNTVGAAEGGFTGGPSVMEQMADYNGEMEPGERPAVRYGAIPVTTDGEDRVSQTARTAYEAAATPDDFIPEMENAIVEGDFSYLPTTNDETTRDARVWIMDRGWSRAVADWQSDVKSGKVNARTAAIGALLYNNAVNAGDHKAAMRILTLYAASQRNAAQALQASRILKRLSPEMKLYGILQTVEGFMEEAGINPADGITISEELQQRFMDAQTEDERNDVIGEMQQEVADQLPVTMLDKWNALRYVNMLGNFKTQVRNVGGNVVMQALTGAKNVTLTALETLASKASGGTYERRTALAPGKARMDAARADFDHVRDVAMGESRYSLTGGRNADASGFMRGAMEKRRIFKFMPLEAYRKATNWLMEQGDVIFAKNSYARALAGWLKAHGVTAEQFNDSRWQAEHADELDRARAFAIKEAQEATFRDTNAFSDWVSRLGRKSTTPKVGRIAAEGILPFRKTPANVAVRAVEYSPLGIVEAAVNAARKGLAQTPLATKSGAIASGANVTGADVMNQLAKGLTGTGLFALGMMLRNMGLLKAGDDRDKDQAAFDDMTGQQPFALTLPDGTSYTLDWLTPAAIPLFMGATLADNMDEDGRFTFADVSDALAQIGEPMLQMSMLQGVNDLLGNVRYSDNRLVQTALQSMVGYLTQGLTNTMLGQLERTVETERMSTYADKNSPVFPSWLQREIGRASAKIPGVDYHQYPYINAWGETESTGDPGTRALVNFLSPGYVSKVELSPVEQELQRLAGATGKTSIYPDVAPKYFTVNGETKQLTMDEYVRYATQRGQESRRLVTALTEARQYEGLDDEAKKKLIEKAYEYANAKAKAEVSDYAPAQSSWLNKAYAAERAGIPIEDYILLRFTADTNANGSVSKAEAQAATESSSLNGQQKDALMQILFP